MTSRKEYLIRKSLAMQNIFIHCYTKNIHHKYKRMLNNLQILPQNPPVFYKYYSRSLSKFQQNTLSRELRTVLHRYLRDIKMRLKNMLFVT